MLLSAHISPTACQFREQNPVSGKGRFNEMYATDGVDAPFAEDLQDCNLGTSNAVCWRPPDRPRMY